MEVQSVEDRAAQPQAANNLPEEKGNLLSVVQKFVSGRPDDRGRKEVEARWTMYQEQLRHASQGANEVQRERPDFLQSALGKTMGRTGNWLLEAGAEVDAPGCRQRKTFPCLDREYSGPCCRKEEQEMTESWEADSRRHLQDASRRIRFSCCV